MVVRARGLRTHQRPSPLRTPKVRSRSGASGAVIWKRRSRLRDLLPPYAARPHRSWPPFVCIVGFFLRFFWFGLRTLILWVGFTLVDARALAVTMSRSRTRVPADFAKLAACSPKRLLWFELCAYVKRTLGRPQSRPRCDIHNVRQGMSCHSARSLRRTVTVDPTLRWRMSVSLA